MSSAERREQERENLRHTILEATQELLATEGYEKLSLRRIAEKIDYSPTAIYLHFKSKGELIDVVAGEGFARMATEVGAIPADDPAKRLRLMGHAYVAFALTNSPIYRLMFLQGDNPQDMYEGHNNRRTESARAFGSLVSTIREIAEGKADAYAGQTDAVILAAGVFWAHIHGAVSILLMGRGREFIGVQEQFCRQAVETAVAGLLAELPGKQ